MLKKNQMYLYGLGVTVFLAAVVMFCVNKYEYQYPGLFYFQPKLFALSIFLLLIRMGLKVQFEMISHTHLWNIAREINIYITLVVLILFATSAIQYTPFSPIDKKILAIEHYLHLDLKAVMAWTNTNTFVKELVSVVYRSLGYQVVIFPIFVMLARRFDVMYKFYFLILTTWLIGSFIYYFFPTTGPASVIDSPYFVEAQRTTGLKFWQLHHYIQPISAEGGLIAMPSFHVIWGWLCVYLLRPWPIAFYLILLVNSVMVASCVLLGWHYFLDVIVSTMTLLVAHAIYYYCHKSPRGTLVDVVAATGNG
jgi:hypothetical protein